MTNHKLDPVMAWCHNAHNKPSFIYAVTRPRWVKWFITKYFVIGMIESMASATLGTSMVVQIKWNCVFTEYFLLENWLWCNNIDGLVQDCSNSIANALELLQLCTKLSPYPLGISHLSGPSPDCWPSPAPCPQGKCPLSPEPIVPSQLVNIGWRDHAGLWHQAQYVSHRIGVNQFSWKGLLWDSYHKIIRTYRYI